jgi:hypothetical protein
LAYRLNCSSKSATAILGTIPSPVEPCDAVRHVRNGRAWNLAHGVNDLDCERGFLEHVIRVFKDGFKSAYALADGKRFFSMR